ncbi:MAG: cation:proton antiporter [candidate division Zixibacteria bacterium]|nr:cation:proton antiporter [candidate division Zixibacteria bacterium]
MAELDFLKDIVVILTLALIVVSVFHRLKIPAIAGFILAGVLIGPKGLGLVDDSHQVELFAEIGVALLLFGIGLEMSLDRLRRLWRPIIIGGMLQVGLTILISYAIGRLFGLSGPAALFVGFLLSISSTAIVLRGLDQRGEVEAPHGRLTLGILVFQDLSVVPMMLLIPFLAASAGGIESGAALPDLLSALGRALGILIVVLFAARMLVPRLLAFVAETRQRHLFVLAVLLVCIGTTWFAASGGVSLAIGAFLAGMVVAGNQFRHQALADLIPFREAFTSMFFISIGMLLAPAVFVDEFTPIALLLVAILLGKSLVVFLSGIIMRLPLRVTALTAFALAQVGEFSLVMITTAAGSGLLDGQLETHLLAAAILSMLITPFAIRYGPHLAAGAGKVRALAKLMKVSTAEEALEKTGGMRDHVIIGGYGFTGVEVAYALKEAGIDYVITDLNPENVRIAADAGEQAYFGDITNADTLVHLGAARASELVLAINDPSANERAVKAARSVAPDLHIIVRTRYLLDVKPLLDAGASEVIPAELEAAVEVTSRLLRRHQVDPDLLAELYSRIRSHREDPAAG